MTEKKTAERGNCAICGQPYAHFGNNPEPILTYEERVCDDCNALHVIPVRLGAEQTITLHNGKTLTIKRRVRKS